MGVPPTFPGHAQFNNLLALANQLSEEVADGQAARPERQPRRVWIAGQPYVVTAEAVYSRSAHTRNSAPQIVVAVIVAPEPEAGATSGVARVGLTARERQVADMLARRLTTAEVAGALGISPHTARHHVQRVLNKLGVTSRRNVAALLSNGHPRAPEK